LIVIFLQGSAGLATGFAPEFYSFIIFRFLVGAASMGLFMTAFVLGEISRQSNVDTKNQ